MYRIKTQQFEGPLDLLLSLIEEQKLDITRLSLAQVTDQYLEHLKKMNDATLENLADFLSVASKLILIKSKALLPSLDLTQEEEEEIKDLEKQLENYRKFKQASIQIGKIFNSPRLGFIRESFMGEKVFFAPPEKLGALDLKKTFQKILEEIPLVEKLEEEAIKEVVTLEEKIGHLREIIDRRWKVSFSEIASQAKDKIEIIVSFLALLELIKQEIILVEQRSSFGEITLRSRINSK